MILVFLFCLQIGGKMSKAKEEKRRGFIGGFIATLVSLLTVAFGWILYSRRYIDHSVKVGDLIEADHKDYNSPQNGRISYYVDQTMKGVPLLIVHSVNAAAGVHEIKPIFDAYRNKRPVYAIDLPGFGNSQKGPRLYSPALYQAAISDFIKNLIETPVDIISLSLSSEFVTLASLESPELIRSIIMISPTGFSLSIEQGMKNRKRNVSLQNLIYSLLSVPLWSRAIFDIIASRPSISFFLQKSFVNQIPSGMVETAYALAHQPGAHCAPIAFLSGKLFTNQVKENVFDQISQQVLVVYDQDPYTKFELLGSIVHSKQNWHSIRIKPTRGLPHFDKPGETFFAFDQFWKENVEIEEV